MIVEELKNGFLVSTDQSKLDVPFIHAFLAHHSYWSKNIPELVVRKSIEGSVCFGMYKNDRQIGFARVITDKATFAYLADVFIDEPLRGKGLAQWMMQFILQHPELQGFRNWMLATRDAHGLYRKFGFNPLENPERIMKRNAFSEYPPQL